MCIKALVKRVQDKQSITCICDAVPEQYHIHCDAGLGQIGYINWSSYLPCQYNYEYIPYKYVDLLASQIFGESVDNHWRYFNLAKSSSCYTY